MEDKDDERKFLTFEEAEALLPDGDDIHTFMQAGPAMLGCDCSRELILQLLKTGKPELSGPLASAMNHGISADDDGRTVFIATKAKGGA